MSIPAGGLDMRGAREKSAEEIVLKMRRDGKTSPGERTFMRASRRGAERTDIVLPGRQRHSIMLNIILDTSGSMTSDIPLALGAIADFCEATGIDDIRVVQCDTAVTSDDMLSPGELAEYEVRGYGGSDYAEFPHCWVLSAI